MDHRKEEKYSSKRKIRADWGDAAPHLSSENGLNPVPNTLHPNESSYDISPSGGPHGRRSNFLREHCAGVQVQ